MRRCKYRFMMNDRINRKALSSVEPTTSHGYWKVFDHDFGIVYLKCSECEHFYQRKNSIFNFCPNCGADMRGDNNAD